MQPNDEIRARLAAIVDSSDDAIVSKTLDDVITSWNRGAERIFGDTAAEAVGQHIFLIIPADRGSSTAMWRSASASCGRTRSVTAASAGRCRSTHRAGRPISR